MKLVQKYCCVPDVSLPALALLPLQPPDEGVQEVEEGELYEGREHVDEAQDDEHVEGSGVANLEKKN